MTGANILHLRLEGCEWSVQGSNLRPPGCKPGALPAELTPLDSIYPLGKTAPKYSRQRVSLTPRYIQTASINAPQKLIKTLAVTSARARFVIGSGKPRATNTI